MNYAEVIIARSAANSMGIDYSITVFTMAPVRLPTMDTVTTYIMM